MILALFRLLLLLDEFCDLFDVDTSLLHDFLMLARERDFEDFHQSASLLHLDVETLDVTEQFVEVRAHFSGRVIDYFPQPVINLGQAFFLFIIVCDMGFLHDI